MPRPWLIIALLLAGCAGTPATLPVRPEATDRRAAVERQSAIWRRQRRQAALAALEKLPMLPPGDARRISLARIHRLSPEVLPALDPTALVRLAPEVLRVYDIGPALDEGPDTRLAGDGSPEAWGRPDGRERRASRLALRIGEALPPSEWPADGSFLARMDSDLVVLQKPENFAAIETALDRIVSTKPGVVRIRVDLVPDGVSFARALGLSVHGTDRKAWIPRSPAEAASRGRLASLWLDVPWGRRVGAHVAPGVIFPDEGPADSASRPTTLADDPGPGLSVAVTRLPSPTPGDISEHLEVTIMWRTSSSMLSTRVSRHRTTIAARPDMPALIIWPGGPGAILWIRTDPRPGTPARPVWRRRLP